MTFEKLVTWIVAAVSVVFVYGTLSMAWAGPAECDSLSCVYWDAIYNAPPLPRERPYVSGLGDMVGRGVAEISGDAIEGQYMTNPPPRPLSDAVLSASNMVQGPIQLYQHRQLGSGNRGLHVPMGDERGYIPPRRGCCGGPYPPNSTSSAI
jgi:hypothetical protein